MDPSSSGSNGSSTHKAQATKAGELLRPSLPSVLRTSADLGAGLTKTPAATGSPAAAGKTEAEHGRRLPGRLAPGELLGTSGLPRVDNSASHHQALPSRPALSTSPNRSVRHGSTDSSPERQRHAAAASPLAAGRGTAADIVAAAAAAGATAPRQQQPLRCSGDAPLAMLAAAAGGSPNHAAGRSPAAYSSSAWKPPDIPAVGSVAMTTLPNAAAWLSGSPEGKSSHATAGTAGAQQQQLRCPNDAGSSAATAAMPAQHPPADDLRLMRPIDPTNPSYYWKPLPGGDGKAGGSAGSTIDSILGAQLLLDAGSAEDAAAPVSHVRQRKSILLRVPLGSELFLGAVPAVIQDRAGHSCLLVLPSDKPSNRKEAMAVEELLAGLLQDPNSAVSKACQWRAATLGALCADSLGVVAEALKQRGSGSCWQFRQLARNLTGKMLGSGMAAAVGSLVSSSHPNATAAQLAQLLNSKDAVAQAATAATEATLQAAASVAPAVVKPLQFPGGLSATEAAASLDGQVQQQQLSRAGNSVVARLQSPQSSSRRSRSGSLSPTVHSRQHQQSAGSPQSQQQQEVFLQDPFPPQGAQLSPGRSPSAAVPAGGAASRRTTGTLGSYASLTVDTGLERPPSSGAGAAAAAAGSSSAKAARPASGSPGSRQGSAAGGRSTSMLNPASRPSTSAAAAGSNGATQQQQQQQQAGNDLQQQQLLAEQRGSNSPGRSSRLQGGSRCSSPVPALAPGTPQGYTAAGPGSPAAAPRSRESSPHAVRGTGSSSGQRQDTAADMGGALTPGALAHMGSRLSSATGQSSPASVSARDQQQQQQIALLPEDQAQQQMVLEGATDTCSSAGGMDGGGDADHAGQLSSLYGLSLSAAICVADLVRQVEVACVERGHALAYAWNCSISASEAVMGELRVQNQQLLGLNSKLAEGQEELSKELKAVDFLRREALRFRRAMEEAQEQLGRTTEDNSRLKAELQAASTELAAVEAFANQRLSRLRWRNAFAVLGTWSQQSVIQSGMSKADKGRVLPKVKMLEKLVQAVTAVEHRKAAYGRGKADGPQALSDVTQVVTSGPRMAAPSRLHGGQGGFSGDASAQMLSVLTPEARTLVLATMPPAQRWHIMEAMKDEERAEIVVAMGLDMRKEAAAGLSARAWERTIDIVKNNGNHAARYIKAWDIEDGAKEFLTWGTYQQLDCLASLDAYTAAAVLTRTPEPMRKDLLSMLEPYVAANIVQAMLPPPAAAAMEAMDMKKAMAILIAMDPNKAADVLTEMGAPQAATKLVLMDPDARNSIIESMAPRAAANTLTSMEDALQNIMSQPGSPEMLTLNGGTSQESPVMGAMSDLDPNNAYTIMSYMSIKDKAALLATMEPDAVARLLGCMDPNEAVLLLSALGDGTSKLVSNHLTSEDRDRLVEVLQGAKCRHASSFADRARLKGSFRDTADGTTVDRLMGAYEAMQAEAMEDEDDAEPDPAAAAVGPATGGRTRRSKQTASFDERQKQQIRSQQRQARPAGKSVGVQVGSGLDSTATGAADATADSAGNTSVQHHRTRTTSSIGGVLSGQASEATGSDAEGEESAAVQPASHSSTAAAKGSKKAAGKAHKAPAAASSAAAAGAASAAASTAPGAASRKPAAPAAAGTGAGARERRLSSSNAVDLSESSDATATKAGAAAAPAGGGSLGTRAGAGRPRRTRQSDADNSSAGAASGPGGRRVTGGNVTVPARSPVPEGQEGEDEVPPLRFGGRQPSSDDTGNEGVDGGPQHAQNAAAEHSLLSSDPSGAISPRPVAAAATSKAPPRPAAKAAAAGRKALKDALKQQAVAKKSQAASAAQNSGGGGAGAFGAAGSDGGDADNDLFASLGPPTGSTMASSSPVPAVEAQPQVKLGRVPKNARLIEAMAQHKNAKPKPKGWLMAVVDSIYKEGETLLRKLGRADMIKKQSVPEIVFAYFHNKYGQRALVNENVGSLVNTLTLYQHTDLRLEAFARQLSEEWDVSIFLDFLIGQNLCLQTSKVACIEYPRDAGKDEQYPWVCLWKAVSVADNILGARAQAARERFNEFLQMSSLPADDADVERLRRERREAAAKDGVKFGDADLPDKFFKLPRIRFLLLLCKELLRINRHIITFGDDRFTAMDVQRSGKINIVAVRGFVKSMCPGVGDAQVSEHISTFVSTAEAAVRDILPEQVSVPSVTELSREAFVAGVSNTQAVRDHIKLHKLPPARLEEENEEAQIFFSLLAVLMARHSKALLPTWEDALEAAGQRGSNVLQQQLAAVTASGTATDSRFKAYVGLLLGLINVSVQAYMDGLLSSDAQVDTLHSDQLEEGLLRLEDVVLILVGGSSYLLAEDSQELAMARTLRLPLGAQIATMGKQLLTHRRMHEGMVANAVAVIQRVWRARQRQRERVRSGREEQEPEAELLLE